MGMDPSQLSATTQREGLALGKGLDVKLKLKLKLKLDSCIASIPEKVDLQPPAIQGTLVDSAVAMLLASLKLCKQWAGHVNMTGTSLPTLLPSRNYGGSPNPRNAKVWDDYILKRKEEMKSKSSNKAVKSSSSCKRKNSSSSTKKSSPSLRATLHGSASWNASKPLHTFPTMPTTELRSCEHVLLFQLNQPQQ
jgi:hypothetical protein